MKHHSVVMMGVLWAAVGMAQTAGQSAIAKQIGTIKAISGNAITLTPDSGADVPVTVEDTARILRLNPGDKDLKNATTIQLQDLKAGDKVRVRGHAAGQGIDALEVLVITSSAVDAVRERISQDWQKRGIGGLVSSVDPANGTVTISVTGLSGKKEVAVKTGKNTVIRRYAPDSIKFDDAKPSTLAEIHAGDQLRARGQRSAGGSEVTAEEIDGQLSECRGNRQFCRCKRRHDQRSRSIEQEADGGKDHLRVAVAQASAGDGADDCCEIENGFGDAGSRRSGSGEGGQRGATGSGAGYASCRRACCKRWRNGRRDAARRRP